ncbi:MAG: DNA-binding response regulator [Porticoccaceae bacterium]|nr:MAG: DNA-binding response regulator [Porticoccaceae bacterium]
MAPEPRYLVVDDDPAFAATLCRALGRLGEPAVAAGDGGAALTLAARHPVERVVLDLKLGAESGLALIEPLLARRPAARILVLTGYSSIPTAVQAIRLGAHDYLCKPVSARDLVAAAEADRPLSPPPADPPSPERLAWEHIQRVLAAHGGNISATARALGMHRRTLQRKLAKRPVRR